MRVGEAATDALHTVGPLKAVRPPRKGARLAPVLRRRDFDATCESVAISHGVTHLSGSDPSKRCNLGTTKTGSGRTMALPSHIRTDIKHHLDTFVGPEPDALMFPSVAVRAIYLSQNVSEKDSTPRAKPSTAMA